MNFNMFEELLFPSFIYLIPNLMIPFSDCLTIPSCFSTKKIAFILGKEKNSPSKKDLCSPKFSHHHLL